MNHFLTLLKYETKKQFPARFKKGKSDIVGGILSALVTLAIAGVIIFLLSVVARNYLQVQVNKVSAPMDRALELANVLYIITAFVMTFVCLEKMRKTLTDKSDKEVFLRLPINPRDLYLAKFTVLVAYNYLLSFVFILPINIIIALVVKPVLFFWISTLLVCLILPIITFLFAGILIFPYIKIINFIKTKYWLVFILMTVILILGFVAYSLFLGAVQGYLETGFIKFVFNETFITTMQYLVKYVYPVNCLAMLAFGSNLYVSLVVLICCITAAICLAFYVSKHLYKATMYKDNEAKLISKKRTKTKKASQTIALLRKEFITVVREPKHIFSYLSISAAMPIMAYCLYTLFDSLIFNMLGIKLVFPLALLIVLVLSVLTNTFCATNITREGRSFLNQKTLPVAPIKVLNAKVIFCAIVSILAVILSTIALIILTQLNIWQGLICIACGGIFTISQIFIATRIDLKNAKVSLSSVEVEKQSTGTIVKVVFICLIVSLIVGAMSLVLGLMSQGLNISIFAQIKVANCFTYITPVVISLIYFGFSIWSYYHNMQKHFDKIVV